jgi:hypothetical protein
MILYYNLGNDHKVVPFFWWRFKNSEWIIVRLKDFIKGIHNETSILECERAACLL